MDSESVNEDVCMFYRVSLETQQGRRRADSLDTPTLPRGCLDKLTLSLEPSDWAHRYNSDTFKHVDGSFVLTLLL